MTDRRAPEPNALCQHTDPIDGTVTLSKLPEVGDDFNVAVIRVEPPDGETVEIHLTPTPSTAYSQPRSDSSTDAAPLVLREGGGADPAAPR